MNNILQGLEPCFWVATLVLIIGWVAKDINISGWVWFSTLMVAVFLSEYNSRN